MPSNAPSSPMSMEDAVERALQPDVDQRDVGRVPLAQLERLEPAARDPDHAVAGVRQIRAHGLGEVAVVFDHEHTDVHAVQCRPPCRAR
jgi:hypothetical protein